jgi:alanine transaminase
MVPIPEYPLYSATLGEYNIHKINYFLDESKNWGVSSTELDRALGESQNFCEPRAIVVINPGNPTGQVLSRTNIEEIIKFSYINEIFILADEVSFKGRLIFLELPNGEYFY